MKKIFVLLSFIFAFALSFGQAYLPATTFGNKSNGFSIGRFSAFPTGCGAPTTPVSQDIAEKRMAIYGDTCGHFVFIWDPNLNAWDTLLSNIAGGTTTWGTITGTLSAQTDLVTALNLKFNLSDTTAAFAPYVRGIGNLPPLFSASITSHNIGFTLTNAPARTFFGRGSGTAGAPSYISWDSISSNNLIFSDGLLQTGNNVVSLHDQGIWNAREFQGEPIQPGTPADGDIFQFSSSANEWLLVPGSSIGGGGGGGSGVTSILFIDTTYERLATVIDDTTAILKSIIFFDYNSNTITPDVTDTTIQWTLPASRFGFSGEDNVAGEFRSFDVSDFGVTLTTSSIGGVAPTTILNVIGHTYTAMLVLSDSSSAINAGSLNANTTLNVSNQDSAGEAGEELFSRAADFIVIHKSTNTIDPAIAILRSSYETAADSIGTAIDFYLPNAGETIQPMTRIVARLDSVSGQAPSISFWLRNGTLVEEPVETFGVRATGTLNKTLFYIKNIQNFADNSAAITGGLKVGEVYRNGDVLQIVH